MTRGLGSGGFSQGRPPKPSGTAQGRAALDVQMRKLAEVEAWPVYRTLCAEADRKVRAESALPKAGNGRVTESAGYRARTEASG